MRIVIYMRMMEWIEGGELTHLDIRDEDGGMSVQTAIVKQDKIGWDQFFKGRLSREWQVIQDHEYERLKQKGEEIPKYKIGMWWTTRLIRLIIYFALNEWQV